MNACALEEDFSDFVTGDQTEVTYTTDSNILSLIKTIIGISFFHFHWYICSRIIEAYELASNMLVINSIFHANLIILSADGLKLFRQCMEVQLKLNKHFVKFTFYVL